MICTRCIPKPLSVCKLVAEIGIGTIAAGVAKANADVIPDFWSRWRHGCLTAELDQARWQSLGAGFNRSASVFIGKRIA
jgi:hypothetical protein